MEKESMNVVNPHACGIDVGSRSHWVSVGQQDNDIQEFGVFTEDHQRLIKWLNLRDVTTIAMESTGSYWQTLFSSLQEAGFEVLLVYGRHTRNLKGKTDIKDCQWIQKLHSLGMLSGSFLPSHQVEQLRIYQRHRAWLIEECSAVLNKMQKALRLMNFRLDVAISDIAGKSGMAIITAILSGERDGYKLAQLADGRVRKSKADIAKALQGHFNEGYLFELRSSYQLYRGYKQEIDDCEDEMQKLLDQFTLDYIKNSPVCQKKHTRRVSRNEYKFDVSSYSKAVMGVDLSKVEGLKQATIMTFLAEVGQDIHKFNTPKQFVSWLRLAPNNKISGGKLLSSRTPRGKNKLAIALRNAANTIGQMKSGSLNVFFKRIAFRKGRAAAITATARKLAVIIWKMVVMNQEYIPLDEMKYNDKVRNAVIKNLKKKMSRMNLSINDLFPQPSIS